MCIYTVLTGKIIFGEKIKMQINKALHLIRNL